MPWSRSPTTEYAAIVAGRITGTTSMSSSTDPATPRTVPWSVEAESEKMLIIGPVRKRTGRIAIVTTIERLRRNWRISLRKTARTGPRVDADHRLASTSSSISSR